MKELRSDRLSLTPFSLADADELFLIRGDERAMEFWDWPADETREDTRTIARHMIDDMREGSAEIWTARSRSGGTFLGVTDLSEMKGRSADLGFMIRRDQWGKGYAFETASLVVAHAWDRGFVELAARIHEGNVRSKRLLERLGFVTGETRAVDVRPGVVKRCQYFSLRNPGVRQTGQTSVIARFKRATQLFSK